VITRFHIESNEAIPGDKTSRFLVGKTVESNFHDTEVHDRAANVQQDEDKEDCK